MDVEKAAAKTIEFMGGHETAFAKIDADYQQTLKLWSQNVSVIGRILRAHLFVEHFLTDYLANEYPNLDVHKARLNFSQKVRLIGQGPPEISYLMLGITRLNTIRNRIAHTLSAEITTDDLSVFTSNLLFVAMRIEGVKPNRPSEDPIDIIEDFSKHAGLALKSRHCDIAKSMALAMQTVQDQIQTGKSIA